MNEETIKAIAEQLRKPNGEYAIQVGEKMNEGNLVINLTTIDALKLEAGDNLLEIGMGNGFFVKNILAKDSTIRYTGCDFSNIMVEEACKINANFIDNGQASFLLADAHELSFENATFDKVFTINTLYFWEDPHTVLSKIRNVLKPKGQFIIAIRPKSIMKDYPFVKYGFNMFSKEELAELLRKNNFKIINILEKMEPEVEIDGKLTATATLLIKAEK